MQDFTVPLHYIRLATDLLAQMGVSPEQWLAEAGLTPADLADPHGTLSYPALHRLITAGLRMTGEPAMGLLIGERLRINSHGMLGYAAMNSGTLRQALDLFERFIPVRTTLVSVRHAIEGDEVEVIFEPTRSLDEIEAPLLEAILLAVKNLLDHITMGQCEVRRVGFAFAQPLHASLARDMFQCEVRYGLHRTGLAMPVQSLDEPLGTADPSSFEEAARICQRELDKRAEQSSMRARVRRVLLETQNGFPSLQVTARLFHLTTRTLHRRLLEEGTSYHDILEDVRHSLAVQHLEGTKLSLQEIAYLLGYNDPANFRRAFKRWTGVAPSEFRGGQGRNGG